MPMIRTAASAAFLLLCVSTTAAAQTPARPASVATAPAPLALGDVDARATREQLRELMQRFPPDLGRVLKMDPTLLKTETYVAQYPALAAFLTAHPDVAHNPGYYFQFVQIDREDWQPVDARTESMRMFRNMMESVGSFCIFLTAAGLIAWFLRTFIDYRRWLRVSRVQTEVHNKLLERFAGTGDLMAYVQSPAGRRFLESAPIPLDPGPRSVAAPFGRILWSVQAGVVLAVVGLGFEIVSGRVIDDIGQPLALIGVLAMALGIGFILSGGVSYVLSRRLGLLEPVPASAPERHDSSPV
jgi:hypothetical protein